MIPMFWPHVPAEKILEALGGILKTRWIGQGPKVDLAEKRFQEQFNIPYAVGLNSCTSALHLALLLAGVSDGDEVITTPMTCSATNIPILYCRAKPIFCDIQEETLNIDPVSIKKNITAKTKAIMVVHWAGYPVDLDEVNRIAKKHNLKVIEDAAHALGATYRNKPIGSTSDYACFSFQAIKQITCGDGGMLALLNEKDFRRAKLLRWFGIDRDFKGDIYWKYQITEIGYKYHMNDICAAMLLVQLDELAGILKKRRQIANRYLEGFADTPGLTLLKRDADRQSGDWLFTVLVQRRDDFMKKLKDNSIESHMVHVRNDIYPIFGGKRRDLPVMNKLEAQYVSIPLHCNLSDNEVSKIIKVINSGW